MTSPVLFGLVQILFFFERLIDFLKYIDTRRSYYPSSIQINSNPGANPAKLFFFVNEEFFRFSPLSLAVV